MSPKPSGRRLSWYRAHSLTLLLSGLLTFLFLMYARSDPKTHVGAFYGNAMADWLGVLVFVVATKYFVEIGSAESRRPSGHLHVRAWQLCWSIR